MTYSEFPPAGQLTYELLEELRQTFSINGAPYNNIVLSSTERNISDAYDPDILIDREYATLYWPGGSPERGHHFETAALYRPTDPLHNAQEVINIRNAILGASIGHAALARVPIEIKQLWSATKDRIAPEPSILMAIARCEFLSLPLAVCQTSRVVSSEVAPVDARMMHLWYPNDLSPKPVLATLKKAVRSVIDQETI